MAKVLDGWWRDERRSAPAKEHGLLSHSVPPDGAQPTGCFTAAAPALPNSRAAGVQRARGDVTWQHFSDDQSALLVARSKNSLIK